MVGIELYRRPDEIRPHLSERGRATTLRQRVTLFEGEDEFSLACLDDLWFVPRHMAREAPFEYWRRTRRGDRLVFRVGKSGLSVYRRLVTRLAVNMAGTHNATHDGVGLAYAPRQLAGMRAPIGAIDEITAAILERLAKLPGGERVRPGEDLGRSVHRVAYPLIEAMSADPAWLGGCVAHTAALMVLRQPDVAGAARVAFGARATRAHRRFLARSLDQEGEAGLGRVALAVAVRPLVPREWLVDLTGGAPVNFPISTRTVVQLRRMFRGVSPHRIRRLLTEAGDVEWGMRDCLRMESELHHQGVAVGVGGARTLAEYHDRLVGYYNQAGYVYRTVSTPAAGPRLILQDGYGDLDGSVVAGAGWTVVTPKTTTDLVEWGVAMRHCIGSYAHEAASGRCLLLGLMADGRMVANAEVRDGRLTQLQGFANRSVGPDDRRAVLAHLHDAGVVTAGPDQEDRARLGQDDVWF